LIILEVFHGIPKSRSYLRRSNSAGFVDVNSPINFEGKFFLDNGRRNPPLFADPNSRPSLGHQDFNRVVADPLAPVEDAAKVSKQGRGWNRKKVAKIVIGGGSAVAGAVGMQKVLDRKSTAN
jgi:hypothetical protein